MRQSALITKTLKETPKDETSLNARLLLRAGFVHKLAAGIYSLLPLGFRVYSKITAIVREEMNNLGAQEILMPALTPSDVWKRTGRWDGIDVLFKFAAGDDREYALGATHEEVVTPLLKEYAVSYKDFPAAVYQIQAKFRNELRPKAGLLRGREFMMKDLYSFHTDEADQEVFYEKAIAAYHAVYRRLGLGERTFLTYASGGDFSQYSHEFQTIAAAGEDRIYLCQACRIAVNEEIIAEQPGCPRCGSTDLLPEKAIEVGNIFKLGDRFSKAFDYYHVAESGQKKPILMGAYGIGITRLLGTVVEANADEAGMVWPEAITPFRVHLLALKGSTETASAAEDAYRALSEAGVEVLFDDRLDVSSGEKFADADLIGCPYRVVISDKSLAGGGAEIKLRRSGDVAIELLDSLMPRFT